MSLAMIYTLGFLALAYLIPKFIFRKFSFFQNLGGGNQRLWRSLLTEVRYPLFSIFVEVASTIFIHFLHLPQAVTYVALHVIQVLIIATFGWLAIGIARAFYRSFAAKSADLAHLDIGQRSLLTQVFFLYRLAIFIICTITVATILLTFPYIKNVGLGILGSAGVAGIVLGIAAKPLLLNLMVGFQIAFTKMIKIGDTVFVENETARVEAIYLTRIVVCTWDLRRIIVPISYFIDKPFQNWDLDSSEIVSHIYLYCDYTVSVAAIRKEAEALIKSHPNWNGKSWNLWVTDTNERNLQLRITASTNDAYSAAELRAFLREHLVDFLKKKYPSAFPCVRNANLAI